MPERTAGAPEYAIAVRGLTKRFGRRVAIEDLTLSVRPGEICGLAGANGGGKSTSLRMLAGLIPPDRGEGSVLGCDLVRAVRRVRHKVGYLAQRSVLYPTLSVLSWQSTAARGRIFTLQRTGATPRAYDQLLQLSKQHCYEEYWSLWFLRRDRDQACSGSTTRMDARRGCWPQG
jgi:ABC-type Na+ transport system ATPase subunit NatA